MKQGFIFGGNTGTTYEDLKRQRALAAQLARGANTRTPRNVGEGLTAIGRALAARSLNRKGDRLQQHLLAAETGPPAGNPQRAIIESLMGGGGSAQLKGGAAEDTLGLTPYPDQPFDDEYDPNVPFGMGPEHAANRAEFNAIDHMSPEQIQMLQQYDPASQDRMMRDPSSMQPPPFDDMRMLQGGGGMGEIDGQQGADYLQGEDISRIEKRAGNDTDALKIKHSLMSVMESLDDYDRIFASGGGAIMPGVQRDKLRKQRTAIQMQMKDLYNLGALQGPDMALLDSLMVDPTAFGTNAADMIGLADLDERFKSNTAQLRDILKDLAAPRLREYGISVDDIAPLRRPVQEMSDDEFLKSLGLE